MLSLDVTHLEAILYTHSHYDHIGGFDDLRAFQFLARKSPMCYASEETLAQIKRMFAYAFGSAIQSGGGLPNVPFTTITDETFVVCGFTVQPVPLLHGKLKIYGFRVGGFAYLTDCSGIPEASYDLLKGLDVLVLDGLRFKEHPTHFSVTEALAQAERIAPRMTYLTHMNHDVLHAATEEMLPPNVRLAYDGLSFEFPDH